MQERCSLTANLVKKNNNNMYTALVPIFWIAFSSFYLYFINNCLHSCTLGFKAFLLSIKDPVSQDGGLFVSGLCYI